MLIIFCCADCGAHELVPEPEDDEEEDNEEEDNDDSPVKDTVFGNSTPHANKSKNQHRQFRFVKHVSKRYAFFVGF